MSAMDRMTWNPAQPIDEAARRVLLEWLAALEAVLDEGDDRGRRLETLRGLSVWMDAFRRPLGPAGRSEHRKAVRRLVAQLEDREAFSEALEVLETAPTHFSPRKRRSLEQATKSLRLAFEAEEGPAALAVDGETRSLLKRLRRQARRWEADLLQSAECDGLGPRLAELLDEAGEQLMARLEEARDRPQPEVASAVFEGLNRVMALARPAAEHAPSLRGLMESLSDLRSLLQPWLALVRSGAVLERMVMTDDQRPTASLSVAGKTALQAFIEVCSRNAEGAGDKFASSWSDSRMQDLRARIADVAASLNDRPPPEATERIYPLKRMPRLPECFTMCEVHEGWIDGEKIHEHIRSEREADGPRRFYRRLALGTGTPAVSVEETIPEDLFRTLWDYVGSAGVKRRCYKVEEGALTWEIDEYLDRPLILARVLLPPGVDEPPLPPWLERHLERERRAVESPA